MRGTLYMGVRPTKERIKVEMNKLRKEHEITKMELNESKDTILFEFEEIYQDDE